LTVSFRQHSSSRTFWFQYLFGDLKTRLGSHDRWLSASVQPGTSMSTTTLPILVETALRGLPLLHSNTV
jgi:hypothetical protein